MNFKLDLTLLEEHSMEYGEESQATALRWFPVWSKGTSLKVACPPFKCREFLSDWLWYVYGLEGQMYGWESDSVVPQPDGWMGMEYIVIYSQDNLPREISIMDKLSDHEVQEVVYDTLDGYNSDPEGWGYNEEFNPDHRYFVLKVPDMAKNPVGLLLWSLAIRSQVESQEVSGFSLPDKPCGNYREMLDEHWPGGWLEMEDRVRMMQGLYSFCSTFPMIPEGLTGCIGDVTHEYFSPMSVLQAAVNGLTYKKQMRLGHMGDVFDYRMKLVTDIREWYLSYKETYLGGKDEAA